MLNRTAGINETWMDYLAKQNLIEPGTRTNLLGNALVVAVPKGESFAVHPEKGFDFAGAFTGRLALGDPSHVHCRSGSGSSEVLSIDVTRVASWSCWS